MTNTSSLHYYIRFRGRTTGPFSESDIRTMLSRGNIGRLHQLSTDAVTWRPLLEFDVFAPSNPHADRRHLDKGNVDTFDQRCSSCNAALRLQAKMHGQTISCPRCHDRIDAYDRRQMPDEERRSATHDSRDRPGSPHPNENVLEHEAPLDSLAQAFDADDISNYCADDTQVDSVGTSQEHLRPETPNRRGRLHSDTLAFATEEEFRRRRLANIILSSVVIAGFFWPNLALSMGIAGGSSLTIHFMNIQGLGAEHLPGIMALILLYPLLGGLGALFTCIYAPLLARGITLCCIGGFFAIIVFANQGSLLAARAVGALPGGSGMIMLWIFWLIGLSMMVVSIRVRRYRPKSMAAYVIGAIGGGLYFLSLLLPVLPISAGGLWLATPFEIMKTDVFLGIGSLLHIMCLIALGILCAANTLKRTSLRAVSNSQISVGLIAASIGIMLVFMLLSGMNQTGSNNNEFNVLLVGVSVLLKFAICFGSVLLLIPVGVADLILTTTQPRSTDASGKHTRCS